jgi:NAD(P)-dependent dehydrogenase (short-subunit alcohol dehydrogenase family)
MDRLRDKKALVIGGSTGIGNAICRRFAEEGADVAIGSPGDEPARTALVAELAPISREILSLAVDVRSEDEVRRAVEQTIERFGRIDILVNNAGVSAPGHYPVWEESLEQYQRIMDINTRGVWLGMKHVLPHMIARGSGRIINTASQLAHKPSPLNASYCASKAAVVGLTVSVAHEVADKGITVNALCPGPTDTPMWAGGSPDWKAWKVSTLPMKRVGTPDDQAWACVYMASDEAGYLTGQSLSPNGGDVMW